MADTVYSLLSSIKGDLGNKLHYHNAIRRAPIGRFPFALAGANARISWSPSRTASIGQRVGLTLICRLGSIAIF